MKKIQQARKLTLTRTTLRTLSSTDLTAAVGGVEPDSNCGSCNVSCNTNSCICTVMDCPTLPKSCVILDNP